MILNIKARFTGEQEDIPAYTTLGLDLSETALLLVDCEYDDPDSGVGHVLEEVIAPTLTAVRRAGMKVVYVCGGDHGDEGDMSTELHGLRRGRQRKAEPWKPPTHIHWNRGITPRDDEPVIIKNGQNGFRGTSLDFYLRSNGIKNLFCVGFSFKSCLFYTIVGAFEHNYRAVFLRDGTHLPGENEFRDTYNDALPEKGWVRLVLTRLIEDHLGYSSTCTELQEAMLNIVDTSESDQ